MIKTSNNADQDLGFDQCAVVIPLRNALNAANGCSKYHSRLPTAIGPELEIYGTPEIIGHISILKKTAKTAEISIANIRVKTPAIKPLKRLFFIQTLKSYRIFLIVCKEIHL